MEQLFKIGDFVTLKGGSLQMTILDDKMGHDLLYGKVFNGEYECTWTENKKRKYDIFHQDALVGI